MNRGFMLGLLALTAMMLWLPGLRRRIWGDGCEGLRSAGRWLRAWLWLSGLIGFVVAIKSGWMGDYDEYIEQWRIIRAGVQLPWGAHSTNAYGPLFNLLVLPAWFSDAWPKLLFVFTWVVLATFLLGLAVQRGVSRGMLWGLASYLLVGPLFWALIAIYGFFDVLPGALCLAAVYLRMRDRDGWAGAALAGAILLKYYPAAMLPFLMLDGRRLRVWLGLVCVGLLALGLLVSVAVWGESTFYPLAFAADRPSKWLSIFRFLRGSWSPLHLVVSEPNVERYSTLVMVMGGGVVWLLCWITRMRVESACVVGLATALQLYKVGHIQFQIGLALIILFWIIYDGLSPNHQRKAFIACTAYLSWLALFTFIYGILGVCPHGWKDAAREIAALPALTMTIWLVVAAFLDHIRTPNAEAEQWLPALHNAPGEGVDKPWERAFRRGRGQGSR